MGYNSNAGRNAGYKKHSQVRGEYNLRMSRINEEKLNNSVHDFSGSSKKQNNLDMSLHELSLHHGGNHNHSKSLMKSNNDELNLIDKKKEILEKKRYEQMQKNYNQ